MLTIALKRISSTFTFSLSGSFREDGQRYSKLLIQLAKYTL